jgi:hypothetical protein
MEFFVHTDACYDFSCSICLKENCPVRKHAFDRRIEWTLENVVANVRHHSPEQTQLEQLQLEFPESANLSNKNA